MGLEKGLVRVEQCHFGNDSNSELSSCLLRTCPHNSSAYHLSEICNLKKD